MKLAFWRRDEDDLEALFRAVDVRNHRTTVLAPPDLGPELDEVVVERDELLAALDEQRPAPDAAELGQQLKTAWYVTSAVERSYDERWTAVAETAIDAVRGLWPSPAAAGERAAGDGNHQTSPGAPGPRLQHTAAGRGLGSSHVLGDTISSTATPTVERPVPARAPAAGTGGTEAAAPTPAGPPPALDALGAVLDEHLERLALRLAVTIGAVTSVTWNLMPDAYREVYRTLATQVLMAGWLPPGSRSPAATRTDIASVLIDHEWLDDDTCRCGWDESTCDFAPLFHVEHVAEQLIDAGVTA